MGAIIGLTFGIIAAFIAKSKGFKSLRWILALGIIGFITVLCLSSASVEGIKPEEAQRRADKANKIGAWMMGINIGIGVIVLILAMIVNA